MLYPNISYRDEAVVTNSTVVSSHIYREESDDILRECYEVQDDIIEIYNGKRGKQYKWINYLFYPIHILILNYSPQ